MKGRGIMKKNLEEMQVKVANKRAILESHDGEEFSPITVAKNVLCEDGTTMQDYFDNHSEPNISTKIVNSNSMSKVGQGDSVDFSDNVMDGAYEDVVLKGKSLVNVIQGSSKDKVVLPYSFEEGERVTINDTHVNGRVEVEVKGRTLVNVHQQTLGEITLSCDMKYRQYNIYVANNPMLMTNRTYLYILDIKKNTANSRAVWNNNRNTMGETSHISYPIEPGQVGRTVFKVNFKNLEGANSHRYNWFEFVSDLEECTGEIVFTLNIIEYQEDMENWDIPYFEGMVSVQSPTVQTVGKNLLPSTKGEWYPIKLKKGTTLTLSTKDSVPSEGGNVIFKDDNNQNVWFAIDAGKTKVTRTLNTDVYSINNETQGTIEYQMELGSTATTHERYQSSSLPLPEEIVLRGLPNGVCDTYNTKTKEYAQRIGEVVLDGGEAWVISFSNQEGRTPFAEMILHGANSNKMPICDKLIVNNIYSTNTNLGCSIELDSSTNLKHLLRIRTQEIVNGQTLEEFKQWLSQNPITVQYELATPIVTEIDLPSLKAYNTITHLSSTVGEGSLVPTLASDHTVDYPVVIKPNTKYSIIAHKDCNYHTTNLNYTFDLGGATTTCPVNDTITTVTTPTALSHQELRIKGQGLVISSVRVVEGEITKDLPYFEGICDVKSPIVKNVGKNLFDIDGEWVRSAYGFNTVSQSKENQVYTKIGANEFKIETGSRYENGFGQYIDVQGLEEVRIKATFNDLDTKCPSRIMGARLNKDEPLDEMITNGNHEHYRRGNFAMQAKDGVVDMVVPTNGYSTLFVNFSGSWKNNELGNHIFTVKDVYVGANEDYEPYQSNTTTFTSNDDEIIVLRSLPNGVCDTLNVRTGEYVQNIGGTTFNGSENWKFSEFNNYFWLGHSNEHNAKAGGEIISDKVPVRGEHANFPQVDVFDTTINTVVLFKQWLSQNPITVQYELATPIVKQVNVEGYPYTYENGHVLLESGSIKQSLTPTIEYSIVANRGGQIRSNQRMIERHQKKLDSLYAMTLVNMIDSQYKQVLMKLKSELGSEVTSWDI